MYLGPPKKNERNPTNLSEQKCSTTPTKKVKNEKNPNKEKSEKYFIPLIQPEAKNFSFSY